MGKRIRAQRIGRGTSLYRPPPNIKVADIKLPDWPETFTDVIKGTVIQLYKEPGRYAPLALVKFQHKDKIEKVWLIAAEGIYTGKEIQIGENAEIDIGNALPLRKIPEGTPVYNIEIAPGDGGKIARAAGTYGTILSHHPARKETEIELPGKRKIRINWNSRAQIGIVAGTGKDELPLVKAGNAYHKWKRKSRKWPRTRGVAMNAVDHPFGGGRDKKPGKPKSVSRHAPPGRKVGSIAARRTGRRKK
ncbi:MAG: 50S ribosomal protein L2 [Thermoprotei archaeon]|nr:MAG: 50S ribosomal protein L2 [Thermoprotei archaeon]